MITRLQLDHNLNEKYLLQRLFQRPVGRKSFKPWLFQSISLSGLLKSAFMYTIVVQISNSTLFAFIGKKPWSVPLTLIVTWNVWAYAYFLPDSIAVPCNFNNPTQWLGRSWCGWTLNDPTEFSLDFAIKRDPEWHTLPILFGPSQYPTGKAKIFFAVFDIVLFTSWK